MIRNQFFFAVSMVLALAVEANAAVIVTNDGGIETPNLPGFKTFTLTAASDVPGEFIGVVDFIGDKDDANPQTARGFFGPMNHVNPAGLATVFSDLNAIIPQPLQD